jgi:hypothetical protein
VLCPFIRHCESATGAFSGSDPSGFAYVIGVIGPIGRPQLLNVTVGPKYDVYTGPHGPTAEIDPEITTSVSLYIAGFTGVLFSLMVALHFLGAMPLTIPI